MEAIDIPLVSKDASNYNICILINKLKSKIAEAIVKPRLSLY